MKLENIITYLCRKYPLRHELSKARVTKMVYLVDWECCMRTGKQLSNIEWYFNNFGPYVDDVINAARNSKTLEVIETENFYGDKKELIQVKGTAPLPSVDSISEQVINEVIDKTKSMYWNAFIEYVYSTPPISESTRYSELNLEKFAKKIKKTA